MSCAHLECFDLLPQHTKLGILGSHDKSTLMPGWQAAMYRYSCTSTSANYQAQTVHKLVLHVQSASPDRCHLQGPELMCVQLSTCSRN